MGSFPAPPAFNFVQAIQDALSDDAKRIPDRLPEYATRAIVDRYSSDSPLEICSDVVGNGTKYLGLPVFPGPPPVPPALVPVFEPEFSVVKQIEYPIGQQPPQLVLDSDFRVYRSPSGYQILINFDTPGPEDSLRILWTARHLPDGSTVLQKDYFAVADFAASLAAEYIASIYVGMGDSTLSADVVNYRSKSSEMLSIAKALRKRYYNHMGIDEAATGGNAEVAPAIASGNQYLDQNSGVARLVHGKYTR